MTTYEYKNDKTGRTIPSKRIRNWIAKNQDIVEDAFYGDVGFGYPRHEIYFGDNIDLEKLCGYRCKYTLREDTASEILGYLKMIDLARSDF
tara:strand:+ start:326 stop:598 length:273 start_codon:yes stop_codon:yes gene_type:complete